MQFCKRGPQFPLHGIFKASKEKGLWGGCDLSITRINVHAASTHRAPDFAGQLPEILVRIQLDQLVLGQTDFGGDDIQRHHRFVVDPSKIGAKKLGDGHFLGASGARLSGHGCRRTYY